MKKSTDGFTTPKLQLLESAPGSAEAILLFRGYLSDNSTTQAALRKWCPYLRKAGYRGAIYAVRWDSSTTGKLVEAVTVGLGKGKLVEAVTVGSGFQRFVPTAVAGVAVVCNWDRAREAAKFTALLLPELMAQLPEKRVSLMGFSLGARVICYGLVACRNAGLAVDNVVLMGGAQRRKHAEWPRALEAVRGRLVNVYDKDDLVLKTFFKIGKLSQGKPCGRAPIEPPHPRLVNYAVPARHATWKHQDTAYLEALEEMSAKHLWLAPK